MKHGAMLALAAMALVVAARPAAAGNWTARSVSELIADINAANLAGGVNTITLAPGKTFTLTAVNNTTDGPTALPVIAANNKLTIQGNGATIARSKAPGTPPFRLFDVASDAALTLQNLTLANGLVIGDTGMDASGGAILNAAGASLTVKCSAFVGNQVVGGDGAGGLGGLGLGGAIWNDGTASLGSVIFRGNQATGGATTSPEGEFGGMAGGGAVSSADDGILTVKNCWFTGNKAIGGLRHYPNPPTGYTVGASGALDNWGTAVITDSVFTDNQAIGGAADPGVEEGGYGIGGALGSGGAYAIASVCTLQHCTFSRNQAIGGDADANDFGGAVLGGAISTGFAQATSDMTITDCIFTGNQAIGGQGGHGGPAAGGVINQESVLTIGNRSTLTIVKSVFTDNKAVAGNTADYAYGGAIVNQDWNPDDGSGATLVVSNCLFTRNEALGSPGGDNISATSIAWSGAVNNFGNATIRNSTFLNNRAVGGAAAPGAEPGIYTTSFGGGLSSWGGTLDIRDSRFVGNQVIAGDASLGGPAGTAMGGGITVSSGLSTTIVNCSLLYNTAVGGAGGSGIPGGTGVGGGLNVGLNPAWAVASSAPSLAVTLTGTIISYNQAIGGANGGTGMGGGYAVDTGVLFGIPDTSSVTLNGGSVVSHNQPDNAFQF
ncbi:MAG: hypothetical protein ABSD57_07350 [Verrucomicrobiota bacterium]|jgi:hypothetical protein